MRASSMVITFCVLAVAPAVGRGETALLAPSQDNTLFQDAAGAVSNGAGQYLFAGRSTQLNEESRRRGLVKFDIAGQIPSGAVITDVRLTLHMSRTIAAATFVSVHRVGTSWGEGLSNAPGQEGTGEAAQPEDATWLHSRYDTEFWSSPGGDFDATASATIVVIGIGFYTWGSTPELLADVETWRQDPASNHGWLVQGDESFSPTAKRFDAREHVNTSFRPMLEIDYFVPIPAASTWSLAVMSLLLLSAGTVVMRATAQRRVRCVA